MAAQMMYERIESEYFTAKRKAAKQLGLDARYRPKDLPSNREIRDQIQILACLHEGATRHENLKEMRVAALRLMRRLARFRPALIGSTLTGHIRRGSDIDLHVFSDQVSAVTMVLDEINMPYETEFKRIFKHNESRIFTHVHAQGRFPFELTIYPENKATYAFKSSITGKAIERASVAELEQFLRAEYPDMELEEVPDAESDDAEAFPFTYLLSLLQPLESVKQNPRYHPEGDALYHSLQVFENARTVRPWDEEFLMAALLHDVGKAIDSTDHVQAGLDALEGLLTPRTEFLIGQHMEAIAYLDGTLGHRSRVRLSQSEFLDDLLLLRECDNKGRKPGAQVCRVEEALAFIQSLADENREWR